MKKLLLLPYIIFSIFYFGCASKVGTEGKWCEYNYSSGKYDVKVMVINSSYQKVSGRIRLLVNWQIINNGKKEIYFFGPVYAVSDKEGRLYKPIDGASSDLQPLEESSPLWEMYDLPESVDVKNLVWGEDNFPDETELYYKIKLNPIENK